jgi:RNA polymerase sigma-70 factor (ECF subfamily)
MSSTRSDIERPPSRALDAAEALASALVSGPGPLPGALKERLIREIAAGRSEAGATSDAKEAALSDFALRLARHPLSVGAADVEALRTGAAAADEEILEAILMAGVAVLRRALDAGRGAPHGWAEEADGGPAPPSLRSDAPPRPHLGAPVLKPGEFAPFDLLRQRLGFVPALYKAQTLLPLAVEAEIRALCEILLDDGCLSRRQKELVVLAVSSASANTYCVAVHGEILRNLGVSPEQCDEIAHDPRRPGLPDAERALLDAAVTLATRRDKADPGGAATPEMRELVAVAALTAFLNTIERGLNPKPDFRPRRDLRAERAEAERARAAAAAEAASDPDAEVVARAREGDAAAFEQLVRRHQARVYRTVAGITGSPEDAEDGTQAVFVKVFRKLPDFSGASRFSTWLTRIAINEGLETLRRRRPEESLDDEASEESDFRPVHLAPWVDDPERLYARDEMRRLVREKLATLPARYRVAVFLRDIEQLSTSEASVALDIPVASLKSRLLRGRLMLREALAPLFDAGAKGGGRV